MSESVGASSTSRTVMLTTSVTTLYAVAPPTSVMSASRPLAVPSARSQGRKTSASVTVPLKSSAGTKRTRSPGPSPSTIGLSRLAYSSCQVPPSLEA